MNNSRGKRHNQCSGSYQFMRKNYHMESCHSGRNLKSILPYDCKSGLKEAEFRGNFIVDMSPLTVQSRRNTQSINSTQVPKSSYRRSSKSRYAGAKFSDPPPPASLPRPPSWWIDD